MRLIQIHPDDNVAVALENIPQGETIRFSGVTIRAADNIARGHKIALKKITSGEAIIKYGNPIGIAKKEIPPGAWVHIHNVRTGLSKTTNYTYCYKDFPLPERAPRTFTGYRRPDGRVGVRNELWIIPTVGCANSVAAALARENQKLVKGSIDGLHTFPHPYGCSQMGDDHARTRKLLAALTRHPNAGGVLVLSLGCENLTVEQFKEELGEWDERRVKFLVCQQTEDEVEAGCELLQELAEFAGTFHREELPVSELVVGLKCGGSDGLSGITANPTVGRFSDYLIAMGGSTVLTEVPEMFGAENILFSRCESRAVFDKAVAMVNRFKEYFIDHGQVIYENPSPGNKTGGITTLEDKSCGCVQKGGRARVVDVMEYAEPVEKRGLNLLSGPGNDLVSTTDLTAAGAHMILFTTGRGTPFGAPVPTVKIATNTALYEKKGNWIDFNAGSVAEGEPLDDAGARLLDFVLEIESGQLTKNEQNNAREIAIFKDGVTL